LHILLSVRDGTSDRLKFGTGNLLLHGGEGVLAGTRHEQGMSVGDNLGRDGGDLLGRLA